MISNDTDFIQILNEFDNVSIYNPMKKSYVEKPSYDYVTWKALRGDSSDNIPGIPGIGDKTAIKCIENKDIFNKKVNTCKENIDVFNRNIKLIKFISWEDNEYNSLKHYKNTVKDWSMLRSLFEEKSYNSLLTTWWIKFEKIFNPLFNLENV